MKILLYGINYSPELTGIGKYSGEMCEWLANEGNEVRVICAPPYYPHWKVSKPYNSRQYLTEKLNNVTVFRCPLYVPNKTKFHTRLVHLVSFALSSFPVLFRQWSWKPDIVICIEPTFFCVPATVLFCKLRRTKSLLHIQDFELDAMLGLGISTSTSELLIAFAYRIERFFMRQFNAISTISCSMLTKANEKTGQPEKGFFFPNWVDTEFLKPNADDTLFRKRWNISEKTRVVLYSGNMGKKQGLEMVLQAADLLRNEPDLLFLMVGNGSKRPVLINLATEMKLDNVRFYPLQDYHELPSLMILADIHLVIQKYGAADVVLPSKITSILAVGGESIITAEPKTELGLLCEQNPNIATCIEPENPAVLADTIKAILKNSQPKTQSHYNQVARQYALDNLNKNKVLQKFIHWLN